MKQATILLWCMLMGMFTFAQGDAFSASSGSFSLENSEKVTFNSPAEIVEHIMGITALSTSFEIKEGKVRNIEASISKRKRVITYNPEYLKAVKAISGSDWAVVALFAHEIAHHLNGHTLGRKGSRPNLELEADEFAGFILNRLGASLEESTQVMNIIASTKASKTHPARKDRVEAIERGWERAEDLW